MAKTSVDGERLKWLAVLQVGDFVKLETLLGTFSARVQKRGERYFTIRILNGQDTDIDGWEVKVGLSDGVGNWPHNVIHPADTVLEYIGEPPKDSLFGGWESA